MPTPRELLKAMAIETMPVQRNVHTLNPNAIRLKKSLGDATGLTQLGFHMITLMPGHESSAYHRHLYEEECVYVLSGQGEADIGEERCAIAAGDFMGFPRRGPAHVLRNTGEDPLVLLVAGQRLAQDVCDYPRLGKRLYVHGDHEDLVDEQHIRRERV